MPLYSAAGKCSSGSNSSRHASKQAAKAQAAHLIVHRRNKESQVPSNPGKPLLLVSKITLHTYKTLQIAVQCLSPQWSVLFIIFCNLTQCLSFQTNPPSLLYHQPPPRRLPIPGLSFLTIDFDFCSPCLSLSLVLRARTENPPHRLPDNQGPAEQKQTKEFRQSAVSHLTTVPSKDWNNPTFLPPRRLSGRAASSIQKQPNPPPDNPLSHIWTSLPWIQDSGFWIQDTVHWKPPGHWNWTITLPPRN